MQAVFKILWPLAVVILVSATITACAPVKVINALTSGSTYQKSADLPYGPLARQKLDVYTPSKASGPAPVVVFIYGGSWNMGERNDYLFVAEALAARGIVAVLPDYRLYPEVRYPSFLEDTAQAVAWTNREISRYGGDPRRIFVMGHSAGAYNAAMMALDPRWLGAQQMQPSQLRGWIGLAGPYDFIPIVNEDVRPVFFYPNTPPESQPINHVSSQSPPALLMAPEKDELVNPRRNTGGMAAKLRSVGVPVSELYFDKTSHVSLLAAIAWPLRSLAPVLDTAIDFIQSDGGRNAKPQTAPAHQATAGK